MYHDDLRIYLVGFSDADAQIVKSIEPLPAFTHEFSESDRLDTALAANANVILLCSNDAEDAKSLAESAATSAPDAAEIILIAPCGTARVLSEESKQRIADIWAAPLDSADLEYHFRNWQRFRKTADDAWQTDQFLNATIDSIPSLVWYKTRDGVHEKVNDSFCSTVGKTKEQVQGQRHAYIWDVEEDDPACIESEEEVMSTGKTGIAEEEVQTGEGQRLLTTYKSPLYDIDGSVMGTVGVGIDITQERAYENSLIEKNKSLEAIFTTLDAGVLTHSMDGSHILGVNQIALDILGFESEEEMMKKGFDMIAPTVAIEDQPRLRHEISTLKETGDSVSTEYRVRHEDGRLLHVMGNIKVIEKDGERFYQRFLLDITDRKAREELKERRSRDLIQALSKDYLVVISYDVDTGEGDVLRLASSDVGQLDKIFSNDGRMEDILSDYIDTRVIEDDRQMMHELLSPENLLVELDGRERLDRLYRAHWGDQVQYRQATVVRSGGWESDRNVVIGFRNVDQQVREELEQKTLLEAALGEANRANEAKSAFLLNMSHDIRTPMNAIVGFTTLAANHLDQRERVSDYLSKIKYSSDHLLNLINDILDMSRIEQGKATLDEDRCSLVEVLDDLGTMLATEAANKGLTLEVDTSRIEHAEVVCDRLKVNQVLLNLLGNSIKFTPAGGTVRACAEEMQGAPAGFGSYRITVEDTGIGMSEDFLQYIFDPFERERTQTISGIQGSGLGMAIVKNLVEMMNGSVTVESEVGVGTRFTVSLTLRLADGEANAGATPDGAHVTFTPERASKYRILLVDDNMLNREIAEDLLLDAGFRVVQAEDGQQAIDKLLEAGAGYYDVVLMDIQMPVMNGYEAAMAIRSFEDPQLASVPILAVTADAFDEDRDRALECGMNGHLPKPIDVSKLFAFLDSFLGA